MNSHFDAVVFDMDGVLIDAREWHYEALNKALGLLGYGIDRYDHVFTYDGLPTRRKLELLSREQGLPVSLHPFINELKQKYTLEIVYSRCRPRFQHEYTLSRLRSSGIRLGLASNSVRRTIEVMMAQSGLAPYLEAIVSNEDVAKAKPDPEIYLIAMQRLGVSPQRTLVVEDNAHGVAAARSSGATVLVVSDPSEVTWDRLRERLSRPPDASP